MIRTSLCLLLLALALPVRAESPADIAATPTVAPAPVTDGPTVASVQVRLEAARKELTDLQYAPLPDGATPEDGITRRAVLQDHVRILQRYVDVLREMENVRERATDFAARPTTWPGAKLGPPFPVRLVDELREAVRALEQKIESAVATLQLAARNQEEAQQALQITEARLRQASERAEKVGTAMPPREIWFRELNRIRSRVGTSSLGLLEAERALAEQELAEHRARHKILRQELSNAAKQIRFDRSDLTRAQTQISQDRDELGAELDESLSEHETAHAALAAARKALTAGVNAQAADQSISLLQETVETRLAELETLRQKISVARTLLDVLNAQENLWDYRFALAQKTSTTTLSRAASTLAGFIDRARGQRELASRQADVTSRVLADLEERLRAKTDPDKIIPLVRARLEAVRERDAALQRAQRTLDGFIWLATRVKDGVDEQNIDTPLTDRVKVRVTALPTLFRRVLNHELFAAEDVIEVDGQKITGRRSITVEKVAIAVLILLFGYLLCRILARYAQRGLVNRFHVDPALANLIRRWVLVILVFGLAIVALTIVRIPLTAFAFLGGALAIGVGFGTQNLLKNFISGVILLLERPLKVGDVLDVGTTRGRVSSIGIRSSVIISSDGIETHVPNSTLLENNVTNWTYTSTRVRFNIRVTVAYGSAPREVTRLLTDAAESHGVVLKTPAPQVLLEDFHERGLLFQLNFWLEVTPQSDSSQVMSDLRHMIEQRFREAGVLMPFPRRDLHLSADAPLPVRLEP